MSPRTKEQVEQVRFAKRKVIIEAGMKLFSEHGFQGTTISLIAKEAGISKGLIYSYFESKEELLRAMVLETIFEMFGIVEEHLSTEKTDHSFGQLIEAYFKWVIDNAEFLRIYFGIVLQPNIMRLFEAEFMELAQPAFNHLAQYFEFKKYTNPMVETRYLTALLDGVFMNYITDPYFPVNEIKQKILNQYLN